MDEVTAEAAVLAEEVLASPDLFQQASDGMVLLRELFQEDGPLASLRWSWEELVPVVERHIYRVTEEVEDMDERRTRLFARCAPELLSPERVERFEQEFRRALMAPERTPEERRALAMAVLTMRGASRHPPYTSRRRGMVSWLMMAQVSEWAGRRSRMQAAVEWALGEEPGRARGPGMSARTMQRIMEEPEEMMAAVRDAAEADPEMTEMLEKYEKALLLSIINGQTPEVLHGEEWLWLTVVLREPLRIEPEEAELVDVAALLARLDEEVKQTILTRVEAASRDRSSLPEAQQWFEWAYKTLRVRPLAFSGACAKAREAQLLERFEGEAELVHESYEEPCPRREDPAPSRAGWHTFPVTEVGFRRCRSLCESSRWKAKGRSFCSLPSASPRQLPSTSPWPDVSRTRCSRKDCSNPSFPDARQPELARPSSTPQPPGGRGAAARARRSLTAMPRPSARGRQATSTSWPCSSASRSRV